VNDLEDFYFEWLLRRIDPEGLREGVIYICSLLHNCVFRRRVGRDINFAVDGAGLRKLFLHDEEDYDPDEAEDLLMRECSWFEMLVVLADKLDYLYDGGVEGRFLELTSNMGLDPLLAPNIHKSKRMETFDQGFVNIATSRIDNNRFDRNGRGGLFPLNHQPYQDQREVEIWLQHAAYFNERLEGVLWTSTNSD
jgi:hypothetical protein